MADVDEGGCYYDENNGSLFETDDEGGVGSQIVCRCGSKDFDVDHDKYYGWCAHQVAKDKD